MRESNEVHQARDLRIHDLVPDFRLLDVWALPAVGKRDEFDVLLEGMASFDPADSGSAITRLLFSVRFHLGALLGWDDPTERPIPGTSETSLRERLPDELRATVVAPQPGEVLRGSGFAPLYRTPDEWAIEASNATMHGVLHLSWVEEDPDHHRARMAIYVKPRGFKGQAYMKLIEPFRHLIVYPALMRQIEREWRARQAA